LYRSTHKNNTVKSESETLTAKESLDLIATMIETAKGNVQRNNFYYILWGWVTVIANLGMYALQQAGYQHFYAIWLITIPAWIITFFRMRADSREERVVTHFDRIIGALWISYGVTIFLLVAFGYKMNFQINPAVLIVSAVPTMVSGITLNFRPLIAGSVSLWLLGATCYLVDFDVQPLIGAAAITSGFLIPGYMLKRHKD
jgi:hypothetical protein